MKSTFNDIYVPFAQMTAPAFDLLTRAAVPPATVIPALRAAVSTIDPRLPISSVSTLEQRVDNALAGGPLQPADGQRRSPAPRCSSPRSASLARWRMQCRNAGASSACASRWARHGLRSSAPPWDGRSVSPAPVVLPASRPLWRWPAIIGNALYLVPGEHIGLLYGVTTTDPIAFARRRRRIDPGGDPCGPRPGATGDPGRPACRTAQRMNDLAFGIWHRQAKGERWDSRISRLICCPVRSIF